MAVLTGRPPLGAGRHVTLKAGGEADAGPIARVYILAWQETYRGILPEAFLASLSLDRRREMWAGQLADPRAATGIRVVTQTQGEVVGSSSAGPARGEKREFDSELYAIYLLKAYQGRGFGRALFQAAANGLHQPGVRAMMLWGLRDNPTRGFYEHLGGRWLREQQLENGSGIYTEVAYGWAGLSVFRESSGPSSP